MSKKKLYGIFAFFLAVAFIYVVVVLQENPVTPEPQPSKEIYYPKITGIDDAMPKIPQSGHQLVIHQAYMLSYNEEMEQADWVAYILTSTMVKGTAPRKDHFRADPLVVSGSASLADYKRSGYDRGHLAPAADMKLSEIIMSESFYMSNMSPQLPAFNRGIWKKLEEQVREWALDNDSLYVVTGPVFKDITVTIGKDEVAVPGYYYKAIFDISWPTFKSIAFLLKNEGSKEELSHFAISVDSLEIFTGIDFFEPLDDEWEEQLEKNGEMTEWKRE